MIEIGKLGRNPTAEPNRGALWLSRYLAPPAYDLAPLFQDWTQDIAYESFANDEISNCCFASLGHMIQQRCALLGEPCKLTTDDVIKAYSDVTGYDPRDPSSDQGGQMKEALRYVREVGLGPYKIDAYVRVNVLDAQELRAAIYGFGSVYVGADLPQRITEQRDYWHIPTKPDPRDRLRSLGGHALIETGSERDKLHALPWIHPVAIDNTWHNFYVDEGYIVFDGLWATHTRLAPNDFDYERLVRDMLALKSG